MGSQQQTDPGPTIPEADIARITIDVNTVLTRSVAEPPPPYTELQESEKTLRAHIKQLEPVAQKGIEGLYRGSPEWNNRQHYLTITVPRMLAEGMGDGLQSAHLHVRQLARMCATLLNYTRGAS